MKTFTAIVMAALMVLTVFAGAASAADSVEIRGPVFNDTDFSTYPDATWVVDAQNFAGFWYDIDDGESSETLTINIAETDDNRKLEEGTSLVYEATIVDGIEPEFAFEADDNGTLVEYQKIGFLAEEYVPIVADDASMLSKLLMDDDESYTMRTGETLELGEGYALTPKQIDVDGNKVWLELTKDGEFVDDEVISTADASMADKTWFFDQEVLGEDDVITLIVQIDEVFQGQVDSLAVVEGIWQISDDAMEVEVDDEFGKMIVTEDGTSMTIVMELDESITLDEDDTYDLMEDLSFVVADSADLRFYLAQTITEPGTYEVRGTVVEDPSAAANYTWTANGEDLSFAGFWYDIDEDDTSEALTVTGVSTADRKIEDDPSELTYTATIIPGIEPEFAFEADDAGTLVEYQKIGFLAEEYVPIVADDASMLSKLLMDDDESYTMRTGETLELGEGYALTPKQIDVDGNKVWLELTKDGEFVDDEVISTSDASMADKTWFYDQEVLGEDDVITLIVQIDEVFQGQVDSLAVVEGIWQISDDAMEIEVDDEFGKMIVSEDGTAGTIVMELDDSITLDEDDSYELTDEISFKVADSATLRYYPFIEATVDGEAVVEEPVEEVEEPVVEEPVVDENVTEPVDENVTEPVEEPEEEPEEEPADEVPGFEAVFAIAGLLAVAYFVRRN